MFLRCNGFVSIADKHVAKFSNFLEKLLCYRNTLSESWFYFAKWVINITPLCVITDTIIYPFRLNYHFIITSPDKFHLSCIIFGGAELGGGGDYIQKYWNYYWKVGNFDEGGGESFFMSQGLSVESRE